MIPEPAVPEIRETALEGMPTFYQLNNEFEGGGETFCVPTSGSSNLMWLASHGYPGLIETGWKPEEAQKEMVKKLAYYMATEKKDRFGTSGGTSHDRFRIGMDRYLTEHGYAKGAWSVTVPYTAHGRQDPPDPSLFLLLGPRTMIWATLGWYDFDQRKHLFARDPIGHQVSIHGIGIDPEGRLSYLLIADPGFKYRFKKVHLVSLPEGDLQSRQARTRTEGRFELKELSRIWGDWRDRHAILETIAIMTLD